MKEARIVMPVAPLMNSASAAAHAALRKSLAYTFGGYTSTEGLGAWVNNGSVVQDEVVIYDIACDEHKDATYDKLFTLAVEAGWALNQEAVYIRYPDGTVEIASVDAKEHHACPEPEPEHRADDDGMGQAIGSTLDRDNILGNVREAIMTETDRLYRELTGGDHPKRRTPQAGELWLSRCGVVFAVTSRTPTGGLFTIALSPGANIKPGWTGTVRQSGAYIANAGENAVHDFDLVRYHGNFLVP